MRLSYLLLTAAVMSTGLVACENTNIGNGGNTQMSQKQDQTLITGEVAYRERIMLRPGHVMTVQLRDISIADRAAPVLAEVTRQLGGEQVPLSFELSVPTDKLVDRRRYAVSARLEDAEGNLAWITDTANIIDISVAEQDLGVLNLVQASSSQPAGGNSSMNTASSARYTCGSKIVNARFMNGSAEIDMDGTTYDLSSVVSASGTKYERIDQRGRVAFWTKGDSARLEMNGETYDCSVLEAAAQPSLSSKLTKGEWVAEDINNTGVIDNSRVTLNFNEEGQLYGSSGCNNYTTSYENNGNRLLLKAIAGTRKACVPALMNQEDKFYAALSGDLSIDFGPNGALRILSDSGDTIKARLASN